MSEPQPIGIQSTSAPDVRASIARAAQATGVDFNYLLAQAKLESSLDPSAHATGSSAAGLYQFTSSTWLQTLDRHGAEHGLEWAGAAIAGGRVTEPGMKSQIMALRYDADASSLMAAELASDNRAELSGTLGREPDPSELYLAHFLGIGGAKQFLSALDADPGQSAAALMPDAAAANRTIFYQPGGMPRSVGGVMELLRGKVETAMNGIGPMPRASGYATDDNWIPANAGPVERQYLAARQDLAPQAEARPSMADTLKSTFALSGETAATPSHVAAAYSQLRRFGL